MAGSKSLPSGLRSAPGEDESPGNCCWKVWPSDSSAVCSESGSPMRVCVSWWPSVPLTFHAWAKSPWMANRCGLRWGFPSYPACYSDRFRF